jgi:MinD superfamily P-loop ATPase
MKIVIASGKGGVGKSMLASSLAILFSKKRKVIACDCDVDTPNLGLWLGITRYKKIKKISTSEKARIVNQDACDDRILEICRFYAIDKKDNEYIINPLLCEGCGVCKIIYPNAIEIKPIENAEIRMQKTKYNFSLISAQLYPGESGSGKIVQEIRKLAERFDYDVMILDSAAGIGCPVIASISGCDLAVLITEPTPSGFSDLKRVLEIINHFKIPYGIVINKWDINPLLSREMKDWSKGRFLGMIPYNRKVIEAIVNLRPVIEVSSKVANNITKIFNNLNSFLVRI